MDAGENMPRCRDLGSHARRMSTVDDGGLVILAALGAICHVAVVLALLQRYLLPVSCFSYRTASVSSTLHHHHYITITILLPLQHLSNYGVYTASLSLASYFPSLDQTNRT